MAKSFHQSNLGRFGDTLPCDLRGYVHMTISGWMSAPVDFGSERLTRAELRDWAREKAAEARKEVAEAEAALAEWRRSNG